MSTKRKAGRPRGSRNKKNAVDEIQKALSTGSGIVEFKNFLWSQIQDKDVTDLQKTKYTAEYHKLMVWIHEKGIVLEEIDHTKNNKTEPVEKEEEMSASQEKDLKRRKEASEAGAVVYKFS